MKIYVYRTWPKGPGRQSPVVAQITGSTYAACEKRALELYNPNECGWHTTTDGLEVIESEVEKVNA